MSTVPAQYPPPFKSSDYIVAPQAAEDERIDVGVLIVGAGPAGLATAATLGSYGVETLVFDRRPATSTLPRATVASTATMELLRRWGLEQRVWDRSLDVEWQAVRAVVDRLHDEYGHHHWVHVLPNAALLAAALTHARGDFTGSICRAVSGGWDTDSNGATAGSVAGLLAGSPGALPSRWTAPLKNRLATSVSGFDGTGFDTLARLTCDLALPRPSPDRQETPVP